MNRPQESSHTQTYKELLAQNFAAGMDRDLADVKARQALGRKMTDRDKAILAKNAASEYSHDFDDTYRDAEALGEEVRKAEDARKKVKSTMSLTEAVEASPRLLILNPKAVSQTIKEVFGNELELSAKELELLVRDFKANESAIKKTRSWPIFEDTLEKWLAAHKKQINLQDKPEGEDAILSANLNTVIDRLSA